MPRKAPAKPARKTKDRQLLEKLMTAINQEDSFYDELCNDKKRLIHEISKATGIEIHGDTTREIEINLHLFAMEIPDVDSYLPEDFEVTVTVRHVPSGIKLTKDVGVYEITEA